MSLLFHILIIPPSSALKLQMQPMLLSTSYNSLPTVLSNLRHSFIEVAQKSYHYIHSLPASKQPPNKLITRTYELSSSFSRQQPRSRKSQKHSAGGIPTRSPIVVLIARFTAYGRQSGRDAQFVRDLWPNVKD